MAEGAGSREEFLPAHYQPALRLDRLILRDGAPGAGDRMELDVLIVGAGPAGLAAAIELAQLAKREGTELSIGVLEKAAALGEHSLSGAVVNPRAFRRLFPELKDSDLPVRGVVERSEFTCSRPARPSRSPRRPRCAIAEITWPRCARSCAGWGAKPRRWASTSSPASRR